jgi:tetratricopeptide (TPR) repeat protein
MELYNEAIQDLDIALTLDPDNYSIHANRGQVHRLLKEYNKALEDYTSAINCGGHKLPGAYNNRAFCYAKLEQYEEAIDDYSKAIECDPKNTHALYNRGLSYIKLENYERVRLHSNLD